MNCPCCGQVIPAGIEITFSDLYTSILRDGKCVTLTPAQYKIAKAVKTHGQAMPELVRLVYEDDPNGGPLTAHNTVSVHIAKANQRLREIKLRIGAVRKGAWAPPYRLIDVA